MWVKGTQKTTLVLQLVTAPGLPYPFLVRNLEEVGCPKAKQLEQVDPGPLLAQEKAGLLSIWIMTEGVDCNPERCCTIWGYMNNVQVKRPAKDLNEL